MHDSDVELAAAAIAKEGFPKGQESARDYRLRLARAALNAVREFDTPIVSDHASRRGS